MSEENEATNEPQPETAAEPAPETEEIAETENAAPEASNDANPDGSEPKAEDEPPKQEEEENKEEPPGEAAQEVTDQKPEEESPKQEEPQPPKPSTPQKPEEDAKAHLTSSFFYDDSKLFEESKGHTDFDATYCIHHIFGFDLTHRYNAIPVNETTLIITAGNYAFFLDLVTGSEQIISGHNQGIMCCAVHPNSEYVAIGESGESPNVLIYQFPSLKLYRILRNGTESSYTALNFSPDGAMIACVGTFPDYTLTIWDWEKENLILRSKAFSQDIFRVTFSEKLHGHLVTSGVGHIRFWEMAKTFTGLKLQGEIGKFGNIEISDTSGYSMFDDGKVLSGSESGTLLLWQDAFVKCEFVREGGKKCHNGMIEIVFHKTHDIITAGRDGVIRTWDYQTIDTAETDDTAIPIELTMKKKLRIAKGASIRSMYPLGDEYLIVDSSNGLWKADLANKKVQIVQKFHAGAIRSIAFSPNAPLFVTGGDDGYIRLWEVQNKMLLSELKFESAVTRIMWAPLEFDPEGVSIYAGFADGCLRVILAGINGLILKQPLKPHTQPIRDIVQSPAAKMLATTGDDGALFFLRAENDLQPVGFTYINGRKPLTKEQITQSAITGEPIKDDRVYAKGLRIRWGDVVSVECDDGTVSSVSPPSGFPSDTAESFYLDIPVETLQSGGIDENLTCIVSRDEGDVIGKKDGSVIFSKYQKHIFDDAVTSIAFSNDQEWFAAGSESGELFVFRQKEVRSRNLEPVQLKEVEVPEKVEDIKAGDYSIEEEKQKSELDRRIKAADQTKDTKKEQIEALRQRFAALFQQNAKAPAYLRLDPSAFKIDPFLYDLQEESAKSLEKEASYSTMWDAEKSRVALRKVRDRLIRNMDEESFTVSCIELPIQVSSFRVTRLDKEVDDVLKESARTFQTESNEDDAAVSNEDDGTYASSTQAESEATQSIESPKMSLRRKPSRFAKFERKGPLKKIIHTPDEHFKMRQMRDERRKAIMDLKPPANYSDPEDVKAIEIAKKTIGDYKLKDDPTYIAPEEERMNAEKKRKQILILQHSIQQIKTDFNDKLKGLADLKAKLIHSIDKTNKELEQISLTIGSDPNVVDRIVYKEDRNDLIDMRSKIDITLPTPEAVNFAEQVAAAAKRRIEAQAGKQKQAAPVPRRGAARGKQQISTKKKTDNKPKLTEVEQLEQDELKAQLSFKRLRLIKKIKDAIKRFDEKLAEIARERITVNTEVELAELRFIMMLREFKLLSKLEMKDHDLNDKLRQRQKDINDIDSEVAAQEKNLKAQEHILEEAQKKLKKLQKQFDQMVDSTYKFHDHLAKLYSYNIRRNAKGNESDEVEIDIASLDVEKVRKMLENQTIDKEEDVCPPGCDNALFERVLDLRESKMDIVDQVNEANSMKEQITKQTNSILFKRKGLETQYKQISDEFVEFQHEKQRHLNELNFSLSLQFHQIQHLVLTEQMGPDGRTPITIKTMPMDLSNSLIFLRSGLQKLAQQEQNLKAQKNMLNEMLRIETANYKHDLKLKENDDQNLAKSIKGLYDIQQLKFGQQVDLVVLEQMRQNQEADQLKVQIRSVEKSNFSEMQSIQDQIAEQQEILTHEIQRNTAVLNNLANLTQQQRDIENVLQNSRSAHSTDELNQDLGLQNPDELFAEVEKNNELIDKLNEEKMILKRK